LLTIPINLHSYTIKDNPLKKAENVSQTTFEPRLTVNYDINSIGKLTLRQEFQSIWYYKPVALRLYFTKLPKH
jgi:hypothetical protein